MSHPPTEPHSWSLADRWRQSEERGADPTGPGAPTQRREGGWPAPNGEQPPQPRVYGRATPTPPYGQQPAAPQAHGQPTTAAPYGQQPFAQQPYGQPASAAPYGQPSAAPYQQPAATLPAYGAPQPASAGESPGWKQPRPVLVVALAAALLFVLTGVMTVLFFMKSAEASRADGELRRQSAQTDQLKRDLQAANDRAAKTQQDLTGTKNNRDEIERQKQVISRCLKLIGEAGRAASNGDRSAYNDAIEEAEPVCKEADRYL